MGKEMKEESIGQKGLGSGAGESTKRTRAIPFPSACTSTTMGHCLRSSPAMLRPSASSSSARTRRRPLTRRSSWTRRTTGPATSGMSGWRVSRPVNPTLTGQTALTTLRRAIASTFTSSCSTLTLPPSPGIPCGISSRPRDMTLPRPSGPSRPLPRTTPIPCRAASSRATGSNGRMTCRRERRGPTPSFTKPTQKGSRSILRQG